MSETITINTREVPVKLRNNFKVYCAKQEVSMQDAVIAMMEIAIEKKVKIRNRVRRRRLKIAKSNRTSEK